ncbi:MAG: hypothetical protein IJ666_07520 [Ruminococcus sp.]|nr:hypothetical protein [Ruminococcus sp.]
MSYIWENYSGSRKFAVSEKNVNFCYETYPCDENTYSVNTDIRFSDIFGDELPSNENSSEICGLVIHYLAHTDIVCGAVSVSLCDNIYMCDIKNGKYGSEIRRRFELLDNADKNLFLRYMHKYHISCGRKDYFDRVFFEMFGKKNNTFRENVHYDPDYTENSAEIYYQPSKDIYYYYCGADGTDEYNTNRFELARMLFADCTKNIIPVWGKFCFGIIGENNHAAAPVVGRIKIISE